MMDEFVSSAELLRRLHAGYQHFNSSISSLSREEMEFPGVNGKWSIKDVISHFIAHEQFALAELRNAQAGRRYEPEEINIDIFNERAVVERRHQSLEEVMQAWGDSFGQVIATVEQLPDKAFDPSGEFTEVLGDTVDGALGNNSYDHYSEHLVTIQRWIINRANQY